MRQIIEESDAQRACNEACLRWEGAAVAWEAVTWVIAHDPEIGVPLAESGAVRALEYHGARSIKQPTITVIYELQDPFVIIHSADFRDADSVYSGRA